jgi:hypothetical protein
MKSCFEHQSDIKIINIRLAPVDKSVQNDFMKHGSNSDRAGSASRSIF